MSDELNAKGQSVRVGEAPKIIVRDNWRQPIKPVFAKFDHELGEWLWGLTPEDFERVRQGYACSFCLEPFPSIIPTCPACGKFQGGLERYIEPPPEWLGRPLEAH